MNFEYVDIILLAMIAGFIFLRLRGILGRKTGHEENLDANFTHEFPSKKTIKDNLDKILKRENRMELSKACFDFIKIRTDLDLSGWSELDIFKH